MTTAPAATIPATNIYPGKQFVMTQTFDDGRVLVAEGTRVKVVKISDTSGNIKFDVHFIEDNNFESRCQFVLPGSRVLEFMDEVVMSSDTPVQHWRVGDVVVCTQGDGVLLEHREYTVVANDYLKAQVTLGDKGLCTVDVPWSHTTGRLTWLGGRRPLAELTGAEQRIIEAEQSVLAVQANAEAAGAEYRKAVTLVPAPGYERLAEVFCAAHDQAAIGKGADRHANGLPFHEQRMQTISQLLDSPDGMAYQVCKKVVEGLGLPTLDRKRAELLGAINYLAGIVIFLEDREGDDEDVGDL